LTGRVAGFGSRRHLRFYLRILARVLRVARILVLNSRLDRLLYLGLKLANRRRRFGSG
jgi:hypothetical protein